MDALVEQFIMPIFSIIISKRNSGKTHILQNLCKRLLESGRLAKSNIVLMSSTASISGDWSFLPDSNKRFAYDEEVLKKLLVWQRRRITLLKKRADRSKTSVVLPSLVLVLDDILGTGGNRQKGSGNKHHAFSETLRWLACQGRHFKITVLFAVQSPAAVQSTVIRGNADFVLLGQLSVEQQQAAFKLVTGRTYAQFKQMVRTTIMGSGSTTHSGRAATGGHRCEQRKASTLAFGWRLRTTRRRPTNQRMPRAPPPPKTMKKTIPKNKKHTKWVYSATYSRTLVQRSSGSNSSNANKQRRWQ
jgi:hypothetical protein